MEIEQIPQEKIKIELIKKILKQFSYKVIEVDKNPYMNDFKGYHYKITIKNKETHRQRFFYYSVGLGHTERDDLTIFKGLINCLYIDMPYIDIEELEGVYEDEEKINQVHKAVLKNYEKMEKIGLKDFFNNLNEIEQEILNEGF